MGKVVILFGLIFSSLALAADGDQIYFDDLLVEARGDFNIHRDSQAKSENAAWAQEIRNNGNLHIYSANHKRVVFERDDGKLRRITEVYCKKEGECTKAEQTSLNSYDVNDQGVITSALHCEGKNTGSNLNTMPMYYSSLRGALDRRCTSVSQEFCVEMENDFPSYTETASQCRGIIDKIE